MSKEFRNRRGKQVEIPEQFREKGQPKRMATKKTKHKGRIPEARRDREMARAPQINEVWE